MRIFSVTPTLRLIIVTLALTITARAVDWPVRGPVDFSSGFGDYRLNRFHAGVDIRTGGTTGTKVYSPVNSYVWRIKMSYEGYGKGLYLKNASGHIYVFGHLQDFSPKIDSVIKAVQLSSKRYYQDLYFSPDSIPISRDELIGYSGRTGGTAPHLHFELRNPDNLPLNPFMHHFPLGDYRYPVFENVVFSMVDGHSLLGNADRLLELTLIKADDSPLYRLDTALYFNKPFGVLATCYDIIRTGGMQITPFIIGLFYDDSLHYRVEMDTLNFDWQRSVNFEYDLARAARGMKKTRRLYHVSGNNFRGSTAMAPGGGIFGTHGPISYGRHQGRVVLMDQRAKKTELFFDFIWGPEHDLYDLDSTATSNGKSLYYLSPRGETALFPIDSVVVLEYVGSGWETPPGSKMTRLENARLLFETDRVDPARGVLRVHVFSGKCTIADRLLTEASQGLHGTASVEYEVKDDGLLIAVDCDVSGRADPVAELYYRDSLLGIETLDFYSPQRYATFLPPTEKYARIDQIVARLSDEQSAPGDSIAVNINLVGAGLIDTVNVGDRFTFCVGKEHLYQPRFIETRITDDRPGFLQLFPEAFACRADFELYVDRRADANPPNSEGVCWWDDEDSVWVWLDNVYDSIRISSSVGGGGTYQILVDTVKPNISQLSITDGLTYFNPSHEVSFVLTDDLSGFEDDRNILIELDGEWMIPEYNPDTKISQSKPLEPLADGRHELRIVATDRAGNEVEKQLHFFVKRQN
ncbi:MAG: M23 family metallopeptidase [Candidatus Zixiibacteriota bacterium]|nr:MAG: M23 family metallopeptidase [candidate division Zixibacteria bacterium]